MNTTDSTVLKRLRDAGLRPTVARIGVLQVIDAVDPERICAEDVFRQMLTRGLRASVGTVYRVAQELHASGMLLRDWDERGKVHYRLKHDHNDTRSVRLICRRSGRSVVLADAGLHSSLLLAASREGLDLAGQDLTVQVDRLITMKRPATHIEASRPQGRLLG